MEGARNVPPACLPVCLCRCRRWLNSSCSVYADARGVPLSMREAITEHVFRLMDSHTIELLMRVRAAGGDGPHALWQAQ